MRRQWVQSSFAHRIDKRANLPLDSLVIIDGLAPKLNDGATIMIVENWRVVQDRPAGRAKLLGLICRLVLPISYERSAMWRRGGSAEAKACLRR